jgi:hypothetical protein
MHEDKLEDLKQFLDKTIALNISDVRSDIKSLDNKLSSEIKNLDNKLSTKIDDLSTSIATAIDSANEAADTELKDHGQRITILEQKAA